MTDAYHAPEVPQDPVLRQMHRAVSELVGVITRRMLAADRTEAARIVALLQEAADARAPSDVPIGFAYKMVAGGMACPPTVHLPQGDPPCHVDRDGPGECKELCDCGKPCCKALGDHLDYDVHGCEEHYPEAAEEASEDNGCPLCEKPLGNCDCADDYIEEEELNK